jgi:hypothetical protein
MAYAFDTLGYAKRLRDAGVTLPEAEARAEAARDFVMAELVTRNDLEVSVAAVRHDLVSSVAAVRHDLEASVTALREDMAGMRRDFRSALDNMGLRLNGAQAQWGSGLRFVSGR